MDKLSQSPQEQVAENQIAPEVSDLEVSENLADAKGGALGDPDEGGQVAPRAGQPSYRLAGNSNETVVEDES